MTTTYVPSAHGDNGANFLAFTLSVAITSYQNSINTFGGLYVAIRRPIRLTPLPSPQIR